MPEKTSFSTSSKKTKSLKGIKPQMQSRSSLGSDSSDNSDITALLLKNIQTFLLAFIIWIIGMTDYIFLLHPSIFQIFIIKDILDFQ